MNRIKVLFALLLVLCVAGCAWTGIKVDGDADSQSVVAKKVQSRWEALIKGDFAAAYKYLSPGLRSIQTLEAYKETVRTGSWKKVDVASVICERDRCDVAIVVEYSYRDMKSIETRLNEIWLKENGDWWYASKK